MWPTHNDGIKLYAHFWRARHGAKALEMARATARLLAEAGDCQGERAWKEVADEIDKVEKH